MSEKLDRKELPIQSVYQRGEACTTTIPVHLSIMELPAGERTNVSLMRDARDTVETWYNEDMGYHMEVLGRDGGYDSIMRGLQDYIKFRDEWQLEGRPSDDGFLELLWRENGADHSVKLNPIPVILSNRFNEAREFYTPEFAYKTMEWIEIFYRNVTDPEGIFMDPQKMRKYGEETDIAKIRESAGSAEVVARAFSSDYHGDIAKPLLLRSFAVLYLNRLLDVANGSSS